MSVYIKIKHKHSSCFHFKHTSLIHAALCMMTGHEMCVHTDQSPHNRNMTLGIEECETTYWEWAEKDCVVSECYWEWHNVDASVGMGRSWVRSNKKWSLSWKALILIPASCVKPNIQLTKAWTGLCERHLFTPSLILPFNLFFSYYFLVVWSWDYFISHFTWVTFIAYM